METIKKQIKTERFQSNILDEYFEGKPFCTFDIETMGLDPRRSPVILAGMMTVGPDGNGEVTQYFLEAPEEEHILLDRVISELNRYDHIVTFNGHRFDVPYVEKRYSMINHSFPDIRPYDLDLLPVIKGYSGLKDVLPSLRQKSIEEYMGLSTDRTDLISGAESVELYYKYLIEENETAKNDIKEKILLHNFDDVVQLYKLLPIIRQCDMHKAFFKLGFPVFEDTEDSDMILRTKNIKLTRSALAVTGSYTGEPFVYKSFSDMDKPWEAEFDRDRTFRVSCPVSFDSNAIFINLLDFFDETDDFKAYRGFVNNYLILKNGKEYYYRDINRFVFCLLEKIL